MKSVQTIKEISDFTRNYRCQYPDKRIGLVPTMGYLHDGHISLVKKIKEISDIVVVSIFVNPIQFNNPEDLAKYPRNRERDLELLKSCGADIVFSPEIPEVYPDGYPGIFIDYPDLTKRLCGAFRPEHFSGVLTVVHNLFRWINPHTAIFGRKDYQQLLLVKKMNKDLHMNVDILEGDIIREADGLAMSSRNVRLSPESRKTAQRLPEALFELGTICQKASENKTTATIHAGELKNILTSSLRDLDVEYASIYDPLTLAEFPDDKPVGKALAALAVNIGGVRLIDNVLLQV